MSCEFCEDLDTDVCPVLGSDCPDQPAYEALVAAGAIR